MSELILVNPLDGPNTGSIITNLYSSEPTYYNTMVDFLISENHIGSNLQLLIVSGPNVHKRAAQILGFLAEAVLVQQCNASPEINHYIANSARFAKRLNNAYVDRYTAIVTGLKSTENHPLYYFHHQPHEKQTDVIWVDKRNARSLLMQPNTIGFGGIPAGLQVKVSFDWKNVGYKPEFSKYGHPIMYFDMNNDWSYLNSYIQSKKTEFSFDPLSQWHQVHLIQPNEITEGIKQQLWWMYGKLVDLINGEITPKYLIDMAKAEGMSAVGAAITGGEQLIITKKAVQESEHILSMEELSSFPSQAVINLARNLLG